MADPPSNCQLGSIPLFLNHQPNIGDKWQLIADTPTSRNRVNPSIAIRQRDVLKLPLSEAALLVSPRPICYPSCASEPMFATKMGPSNTKFTSSKKWVRILPPPPTPSIELANSFSFFFFCGACLSSGRRGVPPLPSVALTNHSGRQTRNGLALNVVDTAR